LRQNFAANRALVAVLLAHNLPQNFPGGVSVVGACPPTETDFILFRQSCPAAFGAAGQREKNAPAGNQTTRKTIVAGSTVRVPAGCASPERSGRALFSPKTSSRPFSFMTGLRRASAERV